MSLFDKKHLVPPADALPGRNTPMPVATLHAVNGHSMTNVPDGMEIAIFAMGCFWAGASVLAVTRRLQHRRRLYRRLYAKSDLSGSVSVIRVMPKRYALFTILPSSAMSSCYRYFGRITIPPRECVRAMTTARNIVQRFIRDPRTGCRSSRQSGTFSGRRCLPPMMIVTSPRESLTPHRFIMPKMTTSNICIKTRMVTVELAELASVCHRKHSVTGTNVDC